jgi:hypothetical protein
MKLDGISSGKDVQPDSISRALATHTNIGPFHVNLRVVIMNDVRLCEALVQVDVLSFAAKSPHALSFHLLMA